MGGIVRLVRNREFLILLALALGLFAEGAAEWTRPAAVPALAVVMTLSTLGISGRIFRSPRALVRPVLAGLSFSYVLLAGLILGASYLFRHEPALRDGLVIMAAVPPGVAIIPFTDILDGDRDFSLVATVGAYLAALVIMPLMGLAFLGSGSVGPGRLLVLVFELIFLPLVVSRVVIRMGLAPRLDKVKGAVTNWSFFLVVYTIIGLNKPFLVGRPLALLPLASVAVASTFGLGLVIREAGRCLGVEPRRLTSLILLGTLKNTGLAGGLALALFTQRTALPAVVSTIFMIVYILWLGSRKRWLDRVALKES